VSSSQFVTNIFAKMVAILDNQVICIAIVICRLAFHELSNLSRVQACSSNEYRLPKLEAWAHPRLDLKNATCRVVMSTECIFHTMNFHARVKNSEACPIRIAIHGCQVVNVQINRGVAWTIAS
jgi:hypothetical protein